MIMADEREGKKMVLEYVRWWHELKFSYFSQGINKLLTFKGKKRKFRRLFKGKVERRRYRFGLELPEDRTILTE